MTKLDFLFQRKKKHAFPIACFLCFLLFSLFLAACQNRGEGEGEPTKVPTIRPTKEPAVSPTKAPTGVPVEQLMAEAAWKPEEGFDESLLYRHCNEGESLYWPIIEDEKVYVFNRKTSYVRDPNLLCVDKETGEESFFCRKPECTHSGEDTCISTNRLYFYEQAAVYENRLYLVRTLEKDGKRVFQLASFSMESREMTGCMEIFSADADKSFSCTGMIFHNQKAAVILSSRESQQYLLSVDLSTEEVKMCFEREPVDRSEQDFARLNDGIKSLDAYHNILFFVSVEKRKMILHRYDWLNESPIDEKQLSISENYAVCDENRVLFSAGGKLTCYDFSTGQSTVIHPDMPDPSPEYDYYNAEVGRVYCYKDYVIVNEQKVYHAEGLPLVLNYYVFTKDFETGLGAFQVPMTEQTNYLNSNSLEEGETAFIVKRATDRLFLSNDGIYVQDRETGNVIGSTLSAVFEKEADFFVKV